MRWRLVLAFALSVALPLGALARGDLTNAIGKALFERAWVPAPSSTKANDGLGPVFNARACSACHQGLGRASSASDAAGKFTHQGMVVKLSDAAGQPDPLYGSQIQSAAVPGFVPEARVAMKAGALLLTDFADGPLAPGTLAGLRAAPDLRGLGLLAEVPDEAILARADPDDRDGDGISGRVNWVKGADGRISVGRFGLKASGATLHHQVEQAFATDIGMSSIAFPAAWGDCLSAACRGAPSGGEGGRPEIRDDLVAMLAAFLANVPAPMPAGPDPEGLGLFTAAGCGACHVPTLPSANGDVAAFTDLLLHDLGPGLDGGATEPGVASTEWRTAPLWNIRAALANGTGLLHDGRAPDVATAIAFHGGEAMAARVCVQELSESERVRLIRFVEGL
ncbi:di-heme oxidoredictase family protein [Terrihabitans sp. B22-R8]|uniref:di-heme oxidoredictase family protein n=1 Tax=Terrihabitans sp. B22-R8 TaxID=3425128 RepID=UPI00403CCB30